MEMSKYQPMYCYDLEVTTDSVWIGKWIYWPLTWVGSTSNYSTTANLHNSQITTAPTKPFSSLLCLHQPFPSNRFLQWTAFSFMRSRSFFTASHAEFNCQLTWSLHLPSRQLLVTDHVEYPILLLLCVFVVVGVCLLSHCLETGCITLFIKNLLPPSNGRGFVIVSQQRTYMLQYVIISLVVPFSEAGSLVFA
jgi:hypothetical protein